MSEFKFYQNQFQFGIQRNLAFKTYKDIPAINISKLKDIDRSPKYFQFRLGHPKYSPAFALGSAAHMAILEGPKRFAEEYAVWDRRTDAGAMAPRRGTEWNAFAADNQGKEIITLAESTQVIGMAESVKGFPPAMRYLTEGDPEVSMVWVEPEARLACKGRIDWLTVTDGQDVIVDIKTTRDCRPHPFARQFATLKYHCQAAFYVHGFHQLTDKWPRFVVIAVETDPPHECAVYSIGEDIIAAGESEYRRLLNILSICQESGTWASAVESEESLVLPSWAYGMEEDSGLDDLNLDFGGGAA